MADCSRCAAIRRALSKDTPGWCSRCGRWQFLYQLEFEGFVAAHFRHLACVNCHAGAWCRDFWMRPNAVACARASHVENFDQHSVEPRAAKAPMR